MRPPSIAGKSTNLTLASLLLAQAHILGVNRPKAVSEGEPGSHEGNDTRFEYGASTLQVVPYPFEGVSMQVLIANGKSEFTLLESSDHPRQKFI